MNRKHSSAVLFCALIGLVSACSSDVESPPANELDLDAPNPDGKPGNSRTPPNPEGDEQTPPTTSANDLEAWLENGDYKSWACETVEHAQLKVSPHGFNRVCSNELAATFSGAVGDERPVGTASIKELYDDAATLVGYAMSMKMAASSDSGKNWFWYERLEKATVANGLGVRGCVGCHSAAGSDAGHEITGSSDYVYLQVDP